MKNIQLNTAVKLLVVMDFSSASHDVISLPALLLIAGLTSVRVLLPLHAQPASW